MRRRASATRHLTVPSGMPRIVAISSYEYSPEAASSSVSRSLGLRARIAVAHAAGRVARERRPFRVGRAGVQRLDGRRGVGVLLDHRPLTPQQPDAAPVERLAPDDRQEPGAKCRVAAEARQLLPGDDKRLLGRVLGVFPGAECRQRGAIHDPLVHADQGTESVLVPGPRGRDERRDFRGFPALVHLRLAPAESVTRVATATVTGTVDIRDGDDGWVKSQMRVLQRIDLYQMLSEDEILRVIREQVDHPATGKELLQTPAHSQRGAVVVQAADSIAGGGRDRWSRFAASGLACPTG